MSELSLVKRDTGDAEGLHVAQADFTCWMYGLDFPEWTYIVEPVWESYNSAVMPVCPYPLYRSIKWADGIITLSGQFDAYCGDSGYSVYRSLILYGSIHKSDTMDMLTFSKCLQNAISPHTIWKGHAYSKDPAKYPANGLGEDGLYYIKKTGTTFHERYW